MCLQKGNHLQDGVLFRRGILGCFQMRERAFVHRFCMEKAGVLWYHFLKAKKQAFYRKVQVPVKIPAYNNLAFS